jgi:hypothetical protein
MTANQDAIRRLFKAVNSNVGNLPFMAFPCAGCRVSGRVDVRASKIPHQKPAPR